MASLAGMASSSVAEGSSFRDLAGLHDEWDCLKVVRKRMKEHSCLMMEKPLEGAKEEAPNNSIAKNHNNLRFNADIVKPLLVRMKNDRDKFPCVSSLTSEIEKLFESYGITPSNRTLSEESWSLRCMYGLVKQLTYKPNPPRVPAIVV